MKDLKKGVEEGNKNIKGKGGDGAGNKDTPRAGDIRNPEKQDEYLPPGEAPRNEDGDRHPLMPPEPCPTRK